MSQSFLNLVYCTNTLQTCKKLKKNESVFQNVTSHLIHIISFNRDNWKSARSILSSLRHTYGNILTVKSYQNRLTTLNRCRAGIISAVSLTKLYSSRHTTEKYHPVLFLHCVSKNDTHVTHYRFNPYQPISVIFGRYVAERVCY